MIINNENKKLSRNRKRGIDRRNKIIDDMKLIINKIKPEIKKKKKFFGKSKELEIDIVKIEHSNNPEKLQSEIKELIKTQVIDRNSHEIKNEILREYVGEFQIVGNLRVGYQIRQTKIRFRNVGDYESYINAIDQDYGSEDANFKGYICKIDTPQFKKVNSSQFGNGCDFKQEFIEYRGNKGFIPTKG